MIAEGDLVVARNTWRGTHREMIMGVLPNGKQETHTGNVMWRIANGKIVERWAPLIGME
jgi:predicted ester cyclase